MVLVEGGTFIMGNPPSERNRGEGGFFYASLLRDKKNSPPPHTKILLLMVLGLLLLLALKTRPPTPGGVGALFAREAHSKKCDKGGEA
jgi:hypothetical protein